MDYYLILLQRYYFLSSYLPLFQNKNFKYKEKIMGLSSYDWIIIYDDGTTQKIYAESIYDLIDKINFYNEQPRAIIKGETEWFDKR